METNSPWKRIAHEQRNSFFWKGILKDFIFKKNFTLYLRNEILYLSIQECFLEIVHCDLSRESHKILWAMCSGSQGNVLTHTFYNQSPSGLTRQFQNWNRSSPPSIMFVRNIKAWAMEHWTILPEATLPKEVMIVPVALNILVIIHDVI